MSAHEPERVDVRIPGLRGVSVAVLVDRAVWAYFDSLEHAVRRMPQGTPLELFRRFIEASARTALAGALEQGRPVEEATEAAAHLVGSYLVPVEFAYRVLESARQLGPKIGAAAEGMLSEYLARRPVHLAAVEEALGRGHYPPEMRAGARRVIAVAEAQSVRTPAAN